MERSPWRSPDSKLINFIEGWKTVVPGLYRKDPKLLEEHARQEKSFQTSGYSRRQITELVQNAADAIFKSGRPGKIELVLTDEHLYCANDGQEFDQAGVEAITHAYLSDKRGGEIGRYGLGFKSVLAVTDNPQIFSRSASFEFGAPEARRALEKVGATEGTMPVLRMATPLNASMDFDDDPILRRLAGEASTVVRLPLRRDTDLHEQLLGFQTQFLIFTPHVEELSITVCRNGVEREVQHSCRSIGESSYELKGPQVGVQKWAIFTRDHHPSLAAQQDVDDAIARKSIVVTCAMPLDGRIKEGEFWANFPLSDRTSALGIFNAPWALSEDRSHILTEKKYNIEIFDTLAQLFVDSLPGLRTDEEPAKHLKYLPSRPQEYHSQADKALISVIHRRAAETALIPDSTGRLRHGSEIVALDYGTVLPAAAMAAWDTAHHTPQNVPHVSCYQDDKTGYVRVRLREMHRRAFANARSLLSRDLPPSENELNLSTWLSMLGDVDDLRYAESALKIVRDVREGRGGGSLSSARIVPTNRGRRATLGEHARVHLPPEGGVELPDYEVVVGDIAEKPICRAVLQSFGFKTLDDEIVFKSMLENTDEDTSDDAWENLWIQSLNIQPPRLALILRSRKKEGHIVKVRTKAATWRDSEEVFALQDPPLELPWQECTLAPKFLPADGLLKVLGIVTELSPKWPVIEEFEFAEYRSWAVRRARRRGAKDQSSQPEDWYFAEERGGGPIGLIHHLSEMESRSESEEKDLLRLTEAMLKISAAREWNLESPDGMEKFTVPAPHLWAVMEWGLADSTFGVLPAAQVVSPHLQKYSPWVPIPKSSYLGFLPLARSIKDVPHSTLIKGIKAGRGIRVTAQATASLLPFLAEALPQLHDEQSWTGEVPAVIGEFFDLFPESQVFIASTQAQVEILKNSKKPFLFVPDTAVRSVLLEHADFQDAESAIQFELVPQEPSDPILLTDCIPTLYSFLDRKDRRLTVTECSAIVSRHITPDGVQDQYLRRAVHDGTVYVTSDPLDRDHAHDLLSWINQKVGLGLAASDIDVAIQRALKTDTEELKQLCRAATSNEERLGMLVPPDQLRAKLPSGLVDTLRALGTPVNDTDMARLFLDAYGTDSLRHLIDELRTRRLEAPDQWGINGPARPFVTELGFTTEFAGNTRPQRATTMTVLGRPGLGPLHSYQLEALRELRFRLRSNPGNADKALLELPTGAGKTRVAVESLVKAFLDNDFQQTGPVLWIALSEELCEQAITTWSEVWREFCDERSLSINRFFGKHHPQAPEMELSVVVATEAMLHKHIGNDSYDWVYSPVAVVVDEAHRAADSPRYNDIFRRLGVDLEHHERPLIGLSATPYKGRDSEATRMLAKRFGNNLVQTLGANPIEELQNREILARIDHKVLPGTRLSIQPTEVEQNRLSPDTLLRVGEDQQRMKGIVNDITSLPEDWKVLVFMPSVLSAQVLATVLKSKEVNAASVSGQSSRGERASVISDFKNGEVRVLVNCGLLTQGFDAPMVRALYVARPTLSESQYVQMVGRGLRGPKNGGSERCLVVNLEDTIENVDVDLAYRGFTRYWKVEAS